MSIRALISSSYGSQQQLELDVIVGPGADANDIVANDVRRRPLIIDPTIVSGTHLGGTGFDHSFAAAIDST